MGSSSGVSLRSAEGQGVQPRQLGRARTQRGGVETETRMPQEGTEAEGPRTQCAVGLRAVLAPGRAGYWGKGHYSQRPGSWRMRWEIITVAF